MSLERSRYTKLITPEIAVYRDKISRYASNLLEDGDTIFINASKTALGILKFVNDKHITAITNNGWVFEEQYPDNVSIHITGGLVRGKAMVGDYVMRNLLDMSVDKTFVGCAAVYDNGECQIYPTIIERFGYKCPRSIFDKFERKIFDDLEKKIKEFLIIIEQPDEQFKDGVSVGRDEDRLLNPKRLDILRQLFEKRNELVECQRVLAEMKDQIASLMLELHSLEKIERMKKLEIEQLESELRNHDNQFKKTYF